MKKKKNENGVALNNNQLLLLLFVNEMLNAIIGRSFIIYKKTKESMNKSLIERLTVRDYLVKIGDL